MGAEKGENCKRGQKREEKRIGLDEGFSSRLSDLDHLVDLAPVDFDQAIDVLQVFVDTGHVLVTDRRHCRLRRRHDTTLTVVRLLVVHEGRNTFT